MVTGLLATPEYVRASLAQAPPEQQVKAVAMKLDRQKVLFDRSKKFTFILTGQAVRYPLVPLTSWPCRLTDLHPSLASQIFN
ncbi:Scr1 family TA system antitoxin-like transcriptional regulator [Streptomyces sp. SID9727]|uniref:Scr1 family TA system antitoxin-like transcriptional regulator n=1 Tax=Streptomyces sp. SID9727 TaxID=2706114 RepID=UPI0031BB3A85